jgi:hypothetical protein
MAYLLQDGDTAIGCCPTGFSCGSIFAMTCTKSYSDGQTVTGVKYGRSCSSEPTTIAFTSGLFNTIDIVTGEQLNVWLLQNPAKDNRTSSSGSSNLSTGARIGLGVGIPLGILIAAALIFIYWHRSRKQQREKQCQRDRQAQNTGDDPALPPHLEKPELPGSTAHLGGVISGPVMTRGELDAKHTVAGSRVSGQKDGDVESSEVDASKVTTTSQETAELDAAPSATITNFAELSGDPYRHELDAGDDARWETREV